MGDMHVLVLPVEGGPEVHHVQSRAFLDFLHDKCEGFVDVVRLRGAQFGEMSAWVNDVGLLDGLAPNRKLMLLASKHGRLGQMLVGPCVISGGTTMEGDDEGLTPDQVTDLITFFMENR